MKIIHFHVAVLLFFFFLFFYFFIYKIFELYSLRYYRIIDRILFRQLWNAVPVLFFFVVFDRWRGRVIKRILYPWSVNMKVLKLVA